MEIELIEIREFLAERTPFDALPAETLDHLPRDLEVRYLRRGSAFPPPDADSAFLYIVRSGAVELRDEDGNLITKLGEGDYDTTACQLVDFSGTRTGATVEDTLLYLLPCDKLRALRSSSRDFDRHFTESLRERLKQAVSRIQDVDSSEVAHMAVAVEQLLRKEPVTIAADASIREAAQVMSKHKVSSVMVMEDERLVGLVTDRDLRTRCVAAALSGEQPVKRIMTAQIETIDRKSLMIHALMTMTRLHVHHLPVMDGERLVGMLTATDLTRHHSTNAAYIATDIRKASSIEDLSQASARLPELQLQLSNAGASALHIGEAVSCITDSLTSRLIEMAEERLGPAPVPYAWAAGGSQARREQSSHSDQDNALILSDEYQPEHDAYFEALAKYVSDGLDACGFYYCPGDAMATNPKWRQTVSAWRGYYADWIDKPDPMALMLASIFFDLRVVHGDQALYRALQQEILEKTRGNRIFIAYMASNALKHRPPLGFFRTFVLVHDGEHDDTLDIKHRGVVPITDVARVYALSEGLTPVNTTERLRAAVEAGALSKDMGESLEDALEFIATLRIRHQAAQIRRGQKADNYLPPAELSSLEREHLKDAFKVIQSIQETIDNRYQVARFR